jgi:hypothetical protein
MAGQSAEFSVQFGKRFCDVIITWCILILWDAFSGAAVEREGLNADSVA